MTVQHIVLLEWIDGAAEDQKAAVLTQFRALAGAIPGIQSLKEGKNFSDRAQGVDHAAILVMDDKEALADHATALCRGAGAAASAAGTAQQVFEKGGLGDDLPVVWGLQGGTWTMPCIRIVGIASRATVDCSLTMDTGEVVGKVKAKTNFFLAADGFLEYHSFPIPVNHEVNEEEPIDDLYEQPATLNCSVTDDEERSNKLAVSVMIIKG